MTLWFAGGRRRLQQTTRDGDVGEGNATPRMAEKAS